MLKSVNHRTRTVIKTTTTNNDPFSFYVDAVESIVGVPNHGDQSIVTFLSGNMSEPLNMSVYDYHDAINNYEPTS